METFVDVFASLSCTEEVDHLLVEVRYLCYFNTQYIFILQITVRNRPQCIVMITIKSVYRPSYLLCTISINNNL